LPLARHRRLTEYREPLNIGERAAKAISGGFTFAFVPCQKRRNREPLTERDEIKKLDAYFKRVINPQAIVKARPRKDDSAEVYLGDEFLGVVYIDDEDGDRSYNFSMAILDVDR
jgi:hypothetical protein